MQDEYEAKFLGIDRDALTPKIVSLGGSLVSPNHLVRRVTFEVLRTNSDPIEWIRLRDDGDRVQLTHKQQDSDDPMLAFETAVVVDSFEGCRELLCRCGLVEASYQENYREEFQLAEAVLSIDHWPEIRPFLEIEGPTKDVVVRTARALALSLDHAVLGPVSQAYEVELGPTEGPRVWQRERLLFGHPG